MISTFSTYQLILVSLLAAFGLVTLGSWLRANEFRFWSSSWLSLGLATALLCIAEYFIELDERIFLIVNTIGVAGFCILLVLGTLDISKLEDVRLYRLRRTHLSLIVLLTVLTGLIIAWRWNASRHPLLEESHIWTSSWMIGYAVLASLVITRYQSRWLQRKSNLLFVCALGLLAVLEVAIMGMLICYEQGPSGSARVLFDFLLLAEPVFFFLVALSQHTLVIDGLVRHLETTLVQVSKSSAKLRVMAERDPLTAVLNRHAFYSLVGSKRDEAKRPLGGSVAVIDIDDLKPLNDKHGHQAGDAAIRAVAKAIRSVVRAEDLLFRWGGDEFLVILPHVNLEESRWRFQKLDDVLKKTPLPGVAQPVNITLSVGIAPFSSSNSLEKAIDEADERMYSRKNEKKENRELAPAVAGATSRR